MTGQEILTAQQFCKDYAVSRSTLSELLARGDLPASKLGNRIRIKRSDADEWFKTLPAWEP